MIEHRTDGPDRTHSETDADKKQKHMRRLAWLLDESIRLPGGFRIGADGILGLIPGIGDISTAALSGYIIYQARELGAPKSVLFRMAINVIIETVIGTIPLIGDLFDFYFKSNLRNLALLKKFQDRPKSTVRESRVKSAGFALLLVLIAGLIIAVPVLLLIALIKAV